MIMKKHIRIACVAAAIAITATGCSDDNWKPGPDINPDNISVYFDEMSSYNIVVEPDDSRLIPVTIGRANADNAVTVPIVTVECPEGAIVPENVDFAVGQHTATFYVDIENMPSKSRGDIVLKLPEDMTSPYGAGATDLSFKVTISGAWIPVADNVTLNTGGTYPDMTTKLYYLDGTNNFKLPDFLGSGLDLIFVMDTPGNGNTHIKPIKNFMDANLAYPDFGWGAYPYGNGWFLYDEAAAEYPYWSPDGVTFPEIYLIEFEDAYSYIQLITDSDNNGYISLEPYIYFADGTGKFITMSYTFKTIFSPYTTD